MSKKEKGDSAASGFASPPCAMHEVDPAYMGLGDPAVSASLLSDEALTEVGRALLADLPDAIIFADREGLIRFWNSGAERIFGFSAAEAAGQSLDIIIPQRLQKRHWDGYHQMMKSGQSRHAADEMLAVPAVNKTGDKLSIQFTVAAVRKSGGSIMGIVAVLRDVTAEFAEIRRLRAGTA